MSVYRDGFETPTRSFNSQTKLIPDTNAYSSKTFSPIPTNNNNNISKIPSITDDIATKNYSNQSFSSYSMRNSNYVSNDSYKNKDRFTRSIQIAQNSSKLNQYRRNVSRIKSEFVAKFDDFRSTMSKARTSLFKAILQTSRSSFSVSSKDFKRQNETKIASLENRVATLSDQLRNQNNSNLIDQLQDELQERKNYIEDIERAHLQQINQLQNQIEQQNEIIKDLKSQQFNSIQLRAKLDEKNREIEILRFDNEQSKNELDSQIKSNETAADDIQYTIETISKLKKEIQETEKQNDTLQGQIIQLKDELRVEKEKNESLNYQINGLNKQLSELKALMSSKNSEIEDLNQKCSIIQKDLLSKDQIIDKQANEISVMQVEKTLSSLDPLKTTPKKEESPPTPNSEDSKKIQKLKIENLSLKSQIENLNIDIKEKQNLINALRVNLQQSEEFFNHAKEKLQNSNYSSIRKEVRMNSFKEEIDRLQAVITQKENLISELMAADNSRAKEIERLYYELEQSKSQTIKGSDYNEQLHQQYNDISHQLSESKIKINDLDISNKQLNRSLKEFKQINENQEAKIAQNEKEINRLHQENNNLRSATEQTKMQSEGTIKRLQKELNSLQQQFASTVNENKSFSEKYNDLMKNIQSNTEKAEKLFDQNIKLQNENAALMEQINTELPSLKDENKRMKLIIEKMRSTEKVLTDENNRIFNENEILKKTSKKEISILEDSIINKNSEIERTLQDYEDVETQLEKYHQIIKKLCKIFDVESVNLAFEQISQNAKSIEQLQKVNDEQAVQISKSQEEAQKLQQEINDYRSQIEYQSQTIESMKSDVNISKDAVTSLQTKLTEIESAYSETKRNLHNQQSAMDQLNNQIESIQEFVEFTTIDTLKSSIKRILDDKSDLNQQLNNAQIEIDKLNTEKRKMNLLINDLTKKNTLQISQIERLTQKLEEARSIVTEESASSHEMNLALRKEIDEKENEIEVLKYEIDRMRSIVSFAKPEDLFSSVSSLINSRNQEIEKLTFSISQKETKYNQKITDLNNALEISQNQIKSLSKVKNEKSGLLNKVTLLETELSTSKNNQQQTETEVESLKQRIEKIVLALSTFTECQKPEEIEVVLDSLNSKLVLNQEKIKECQQQYAILKEENIKLKAEIEKVKGDAFHEKNINQRKEIESKMKDNESLAYFGVNSIDQLQQKYVDMRDSIEKYQALTKTHEIEIQKLNEQIKMKDSQIEIANNKNESLEQGKEAITRKYKEIEEQVFEFREKNFALTKTNEKLAQDVKDLQLLTQGASDEKQSTSTRLQSLTVQNANLENQIRDLTITNQRVTNELAEMQTEIQRLKSQNNSLTTDYSSLNDNNNKLTLSNTKLNSKLEKSKSENEQLRKRLDEQSEIKRQLNETINELRAKIDFVLIEKETTNSQNLNLQNRFQKYSKENISNKEKIGSLEEEVEQIRTENKSLSIKCESQSQQISQFIQNNKKLFAETQDLQSQIEKLKSENRQLNAKNSNLTLQTKRLASENNDLSKYPQTENAEVDELQIEIQTIKAEKLTLDSQLKFLKNENEESAKKYEEMLIENDKLKNELTLMKKKAKTYENENKVFRQQNLAITSQNNQLATENKSLSADNRLLTSKNSTFDVKSKSIMETNQFLTNKNEELKSKINSLQVERNALATQLESVKKQLNIVKENNAKLTVISEDATSKAEKAINNLQIEETKNRTLEKNNKELAKRNLEMQKENEELSSVNANLSISSNQNESKYSLLEASVNKIKEKYQASLQNIKELKAKAEEDESTIFSLKKKLRLSNKQITELESAKRELIIQANELDSLKDYLSDIVSANDLMSFSQQDGNAFSPAEVVQKLLKQNEKLQQTMRESKRQTEAYHQETDLVISQCNEFVNQVLALINDDRSKNVSLPLSSQDIRSILDRLAKYKKNFEKAQSQLQRIMDEASHIGYNGNQADKAISTISHFITEKIRNQEVEVLHQTITNITSASDKRKQQSKAYLQKVKEKLTRAHKKNEIQRKIITELINLKIESEDLDLQYLIENLSYDELRVLGLK